MKRLHLTAVRRVLNEEAQKRLDEFDGYDDGTEIVDEHGRTAEWYQDMGLKTPEFFTQKAKEFLEFDLDEDYDEFDVDVTVNLEEFSMAIDNFDYGCVIYLKSGTSLEVIEDTSDINAQIWYYSRSFWEILHEKIKRIINKKVVNKNE